MTYAGNAGSWGRIIVIEHPEALVTHPDGHIERQKVYSRYGHMDENLLVKTGDVVAPVKASALLDWLGGQLQVGTCILMSATAMSSKRVPDTGLI